MPSCFLKIMNSNVKYFSFAIIVIFFSKLSSMAEVPVCYFSYYSTENGLPQYTIMDIVQDKEGFMWFATWDGLSKFDGYHFNNYKVKATDNYYLKSNRIEKLFTDKYGRIWFNTYDGEFHCFETRSQKFWGIQLINEIKDNTFQTTQIEIKPSGKVWFLSKKNGCILVKDSLFNTEIFNIEKGNLKGKTVYTVIEDSKKNAWLLTDNGLTFLPFSSSQTVSYFYENDTDSEEKQSFYSALEINNYILFSSQKGRIWKYDKSNGKFQLLQLYFKDNIKKIINIDSNRLIFISESQGFMLYNIDTNQYKIFNTSNLKSLNSNNIQETYLIDQKYLWFETDELGIYCFDTQTFSLKYYKSTSMDASTSMFPPKTYVIKDINGRLWIQPKGGGFSLFNPLTGQLEPFYNNKTLTDRRFSNILHCAFSDRQGNLWISSRSHGLIKIVFPLNQFKTFSVNENNSQNLFANEVRAIYEDSEEKLWISTKDGRVNLFNKKKNLLGRLSPSGEIMNNAFFPAAIYCICEDRDKNIWLGTKGDGIYLLTRNTNQKKFKVTKFKKNNTDLYSLSDNSIYNIFQDSHGRIWIGTYGGGINLVQNSSNGKIQFINHRNNLKNYPMNIASRVRYINENNFGNICVGTTGGLLMFSSNFTVPEDIVFKLYTVKPATEGSISNNDIHGVYITRKGEMYIATFGGGIDKAIEYDKKGFPTKFKVYTISDGLPSDIVLSMVEDKNGNFWASTENNLFKFNLHYETFETFSEINRIMVQSNFSEAACYQLHSNEIIFGCSNGIIIFSPQNIVNNTFKPNIAFTNFSIFNKKVYLNDKRTPLKYDIDKTTNLKLKHKQNSISIEYAALDFVEPENILYAFKLEGFDNEWNYVQKQRIATYTNLPKGKYVFKVKSTNSEGIWVNNERTLPIEILPPFWQTPLAYLLYVILFLSLAYLVAKILFTILQLRANVEMEKKMSETKLRFFTDISHEIRTPLTMITGPVEFLMEDNNTPPETKKHLQVISQNANRLLRLVNQILDFRKMEFTHLKVNEIEIAPFVQEICENFRETIENQHIQFEFINHASDAKIWIDPDCLEKIILNLLSNAFKYTPSGKKIQVSLENNEKFLTIEIKDEGVGISKEKQKKLFNRFVSFNEDKSKPSTGIGLSIVKELIDKHGGKITIESEEGKGSCFTINLLHGTAHFDKMVEIIASSSNEFSPIERKENNSVRENEVLKEDLKNDKKSSVLIVEDDAELRLFIHSILEKEYLTLEAENGMEGLKKAIKYCPDFIVTDIMMPQMNGIELLQHLKMNINTCHIPIVLLTAKTTIESKLEGLTYGADDYITKPFSVAYFKARIANLIQQRKQLQEIYRTNLISPQQQPLSVPLNINSQDEELMKKTLQLIEENMENFDFSVDDLVLQIGMSRTVFFKKIKTLTGLAPIEFIRDIKMKHAADLLLSGKYMVKEIAYLVGISDTKYFTKCFKNKYGLTPVQYKNRLKKE